MVRRSQEVFFVLLPVLFGSAATVSVASFAVRIQNSTKSSKPCEPSRISNDNYYIVTIINSKYKLCSGRARLPPLQSRPSPAAGRSGSGFPTLLDSVNLSLLAAR